MIEFQSMYISRFNSLSYIELMEILVQFLFYILDRQSLQEHMRVYWHISNSQKIIINVRLRIGIIESNNKIKHLLDNFKEDN